MIDCRSEKNRDKRNSAHRRYSVYGSLSVSRGWQSRRRIPRAAWRLGDEAVSEALARWNGLPQEEAAREIVACCGPGTWSAQMASGRPNQEEATLLALSDEIWRALSEADWLEAFRSHPRIGESNADKTVAAQPEAWSEQEQKKAATAEEAIKIALKWSSQDHDQKYSRIFIDDET